MASNLIQQLERFKKLPLSQKICLSNIRIQKWFEYWNGKVYISFSGGKDSTVLLHLIRSIYPQVKAVFCNTGLEYPEILKFIKTVENVTWIKPKMNFKKVIDKYGYPVVSKEISQKIYEYRNTNSEKLKNIRTYGKNGSGKISNKWMYLINSNIKISHKCCDILKKNPFKEYEKSTTEKPFIGTMTEDSALRKQLYLKQGGCNAFNVKRPKSTPIAFWNEKDIWQYIKENNLEYSEIYNMGYKNTGCIFCMFGLHLQKNNKFELMKKTHPKLYTYCMDKLDIKYVLSLLNINQQNYLFDEKAV